jgi:hypothetical protein
VISVHDSKVAVMARLTILQASQQGFGSTLTIHRHIKDGLLPVYEDGDTKLLEVSDLIAVFGEPRTSITQDDRPVAANGQADPREVSRLRAELDQAQKKNMWLQADLAEAVREVKEKEAKFDKERERLLTVLEQAQALLLRAEGKIGPIKPAAAPAKADDAPRAEAPAPAEATASSEKSPEAKVSVASGAASEAIPARPGAHDLRGIETIKGDASADPEADKIVSSKMTPEQAKLFAPFADGPEPASAADSKEKKEKKPEKENLNPLIPPLEDPNAKSAGNGRALGAMTWLLLFVLAGGGFVFYEYRTKVLAGVAKVLQAFS